MAAVYLNVASPERYNSNQIPLEDKQNILELWENFSVTDDVVVVVTALSTVNSRN